MFCSPSPHVNGNNYEIIATREPALLNEIQIDEMELHIDNICKKYGLSYLNRDFEINVDSKIPIADLFKVSTKVLASHNRHEALMRVMESLLSRNAAILSEDKIKELSQTWNQEHCGQPLEPLEFERQWEDAKHFIEKSEPSITKKEVNPLTTETLAEKIMSAHSFKTLLDTQEILYYKDGNSSLISKGNK
jgi:hypothetical protein